jgi:chorismate mutase
MEGGLTPVFTLSVNKSPPGNFAGANARFRLNRFCPPNVQRRTMSHPELLRLRDSIDNIDAALIHMLAERFKCTQAVGEYKATHSLPPADPAREAAQIARLRALAHDAKLDPDFAEKFLNFIVKEVIRHHEAIAKNRA